MTLENDNDSVNMSQSEDSLDVDINVNFDDIDDDEWTQLQNETLMISTEGADDFDMNGFPPPGITTVITHDSVIVSKVPVHFDLTDVIEQPLLEMISDTAADLSNGTVIIEMPPLQNKTIDLLATEEATEEEDSDSDNESDDDDGDDN